MKVLDYTHKDFVLGDGLTEEQQSQFFKYGFIQFKNFLSPENVQLIIQELKKIEQLWLAEGVEKINGIPLKFGQDENGERMIQRMCFTNTYCMCPSLRASTCLNMKTPKRHFTITLAVWFRSRFVILF